MSASTQTWYTSPAGSVKVDALTKQILTTMNRLLALPKFGAEEENATATQGSWRPWTSYSGPTHRGCAAVDLTAYNWTNRFHLLDLLGMVPFHRTPSQGKWPYHIHTLTNGMGCIDPYAAGQINSAKSGHNGLKGNGPDPDKDRRSGLWPLAVYQGRTGYVYAIKATRLFDGPASSREVLATVAKGDRVNAIMEVRNKYGNVWFVTDQGLWGASAKWVKP